MTTQRRIGTRKGNLMTSKKMRKPSMQPTTDDARQNIARALGLDRHRPAMQMDESKWEGVVRVHVIMDVDLSARIAKINVGRMTESLVAVATKPEEGLNIAVTGMTIEFTMEPWAEGADRNAAEKKAVFAVLQLLERNAKEGVCVQDVRVEG